MHDVTIARLPGVMMLDATFCPGAISAGWIPPALQLCALHTVGRPALHHTGIPRDSLLVIRLLAPCLAPGVHCSGLECEAGPNPDAIHSVYTATEERGYCCHNKRAVGASENPTTTPPLTHVVSGIHTERGFGVMLMMIG